MVAAQGTTAFTYQGLLKMNGKLATGTFDFIFTLYDGPDPVFDNPIDGEVSKPGEEVKDGNFTVELDFGPGIFDGRDGRRLAHPEDRRPHRFGNASRRRLRADGDGGRRRPRP